MFVDTLYDKLCQLLPTRFYIDSLDANTHSNVDNTTTKTHNLGDDPPIQILKNPSHFYNILLNEISLARDKIFLTSLYIGEKELELINTIDKKLTEDANVKVFFLLDGIRNTRHFEFNAHNNNDINGTTVSLKSSVDHIGQLIRKFGEDRVICNLYMTPKYTKWKKFWYPKRFNEIIGLQHMKFYGFDDKKIIMTGANLSRDYFTNRQDRYFVVTSPQLNNYYFKLMNLISSISYKLDVSSHGTKISWPQDNLTVEPTKDKFKFIHDVSNCLNKFINEENATAKMKSKDNTWQTVIFPISQFTPLFDKANEKSNELKTILTILNELNGNNLNRMGNDTELINWIFTAGYFNIIPPISKLLLQGKNNIPGKENIIITASPKANGFYQSKGISKHLPNAYLYLSKKFLKKAETRKNVNNIQLREWQRGVVNEPNGWSYHAKGIWFKSNTTGINSHKPILTIIGSSNYTSRSYSLDLESNILILTRDPILQENLNSEIDNLLQYTKAINLTDFKGDRHISKTIKLITKLVRKKL